MPELPEVETIRRQMSYILPLKITSVKLSDVAGSIVHTPMEKLKGKTINEILRHGKMLIMQLSDGRKILSHLGMSGSWRISTEKLNEKHNHIQIIGDSPEGKVYLTYVDPRRFGHLYLYDEAQAQKKISELGVDLKSNDFTLEYMKKSLLKYPERAIKVSLLDQKLFAGTGNYIANEICARAKVMPTRLVKDIKPSEFTRLHQAVFTVIDDATETGGTTFQGGYADTTGSKGGGVKHLVVFYQKICQMCMEMEVQKITLAQRGTYYCPKCQK